MKTPIILRADDGLSWWNDAKNLSSFVETPEIEAGTYTIWDADGQILDLSIAEPAKKTFLGLKFTSGAQGEITETARYEPDVLHAVIANHIQEVWKYKGEIPEDLIAIVHLLCRLQPAFR